MTRRTMLSATLFLLCALLPLQARKVINVADYAGKDCTDYTPVVYSILTENPSGHLTLEFPEGEYHFSKTYAKGRYHSVTNHDNGYRYFAFPIEGMKDVVVDGNGSSFIFHGVMTPFLVQNSSDVVLKNFSIDWEEPFYLQAEVVACDLKARTLDLKFSDFSVYEHEGTRINLTNNDNEMYFLGESMVFDPETHAVAYNAARYIFNGVKTRSLTITRVSGNTFRIKSPFMKTATPTGLVYTFKGPNRENRQAPAIHVKASRGVEALNIDVHHAGGMGLIAEKSADLHLDDFNVCLPEGTDRMVTTTADATHFCNCAGDLVIENCLFENMLDDATNVHGTYLKVVEVKGNRKVLARLNHVEQFDYDFAEKGDLIQIVDARSILPKKTVKVVSCEKINDIFAVVEFSSDVADFVSPGDGLENVSWYPDLIFRNNIVRNNRARSILISSPRKVLIEGNSFSSMMSNILFEGDLEHWHESGAVKDVVIRGNRFLDSCYGGNAASSIFINPHVVEMPEDAYYEKNIRIEDNVFSTFDRSILSAKSVEGLVFRNNLIEPTKTYRPLHPEMPEINLIHCKGTVIENNACKGAGAQAEIVMDSHSASRTASVSGNEGFR